MYQSIKERNSSKKGTNRKLDFIIDLINLFLIHQAKQCLPFEQDKIDIAVAFGQEIAQDSFGKATSYLP